MSCEWIATVQVLIFASNTPKVNRTPASEKNEIFAIIFFLNRNAVSLSNDRIFYLCSPVLHHQVMVVLVIPGLSAVQPVGLLNTSNSCWFNSLIQAFFGTGIFKGISCLFR